MAYNQFNRFNLPPQWKKYLSNFRMILLGLILVIIFWTAFFQVEPEEVGVITRFGKYIRKEEPGLNFKLPVMERVYKVPVERQQKEEFGFRTINAGIQSEFTKSGTSEESLMLTGDLNLADVEWVVQYRIDDPYSYLFKVRNPVNSLRDISEAAMRQIVGDRTVNEVLTVGRTEIAIRVLEEIQKICTEYSLGIKIEQVVLQDINPPDPVKDAFNAVNQAQQEKETLINQARSEYNKVIPKASGQAEETIQKAEGYATARVNNALGEAVRTSNREPIPSGLIEEVGDTLTEIIVDRQKIQEMILQSANQKTSDLGIAILDFRIKRINYVEEVREQVYERMKSERFRIADKFRSEGQGEASKINGEKERELKTIQSEAFRKAEEIMGKADARAAAVYAGAYNQSAAARSLYSFVKSMETFEKTFDSTTTVILSTDSELYKYLIDLE